MSHDLKIWQPLTPFTWLIFRLPTFVQVWKWSSKFLHIKPCWHWFTLQASL